MAFILTKDGGHKPVAISSKLEEHLASKIVDEERARKNLRMMDAMDQAKFQSRFRKKGADMRFLCSVPVPEWLYAFEKDPAFWSNIDNIKRWTKENEYMTGDK